jgi:uncharacterized membrane protein YfcA
VTAGATGRALVAGILSGLAGGLFGVGGGIVTIPILTALFGLTQHQAHGTSLAVIGATAIAAIVVYGVFGSVSWVVALVVALGSMWTARYGARWATRTSSVGLKRAFAAFLVLVAVRLLWKTPEVTARALEPGLAQIGFGIALGGAVGLLSGYMGVGGGILAVPAFTLVLGMPQQAAQGTALATMVVTAPAGAFEHARHGNVVGRLVPILAAGAILGAPLASWLAQKVPHESLVRAFAIFLLINSALMWVRARATAARAAPPRA